MNLLCAVQQLTDGEICLKPVCARDAKDLFTLVNRDRVYLREWLPWLDRNRSVQDTLDFIELSEKQFDKKDALQVCIRFRDEIAGVIGFHHFDWDNRSASIGYWLAQNLQGNAIVTRSCRLLLNFAFTELQLNRVEIRCALENKKSRAIPERLGFTNEGTVRDGEWLYNKFVTLAVYGILSREWPVKPKKAD
jgi:ribosomal-protein-serine acetyltransferase